MAALAPEEIRAAFTRPIDRVRVTAGYRLRLMAALFGLAALQFLYLILIATVVYLTVMYSIYVTGEASTINLLTIVLYFGPPVAGAVATLFLLKPLIIRPPRPPKPIRLLPENEPALFDFVERLCRALGAPRPKRIFVDIQVNASASVQGWRAFFLGDLSLTIGLPLAIGLTLPQFAGVLAHEFGHFAQRAGMRSYFLIQTIQHWFARVVYQRDSWDEWLDGRRRRGDWRLVVVAQLAGFVVSASRRFLALLMNGGNWISSSFSRHMEFDADRYEAALVGVDVFEQTSHRMQLLMAGSSLGWQDASKDWSVGRLPGDIAALIAVRTDTLSHESADRIIEHALSQVTAPRDTHPCMSERIENVRRQKSSGVLALDGPASRLFRDLPALCAEATRHHYENVMKLPSASVQLVSASETVRNTQANLEFESAARQLFQAPPEFCSRWFHLPSAPPRVHESGPAAAPPAPELEPGPFEAALEKCLSHFAALVIREAGVKIQPQSFQLADSDPSAIRGAERLSRQNFADCMAHLNQQARTLADCIETTAARLLKGELTLAVQAGRPTPVPDLAAAWHTYGTLSESREDILEIRRRVHASRIVRQNARLIPMAACANLLEELESEAASRMKQIVARAAEVPAAVVFDPRAAATLDAQLTLPDKSGSSRIESFLARVDTTASAALSHLAWFTLSVHKG